MKSKAKKPVGIFERLRRRELAAHRKALAIAAAQERVERAKQNLRREIERLRKIRAQPLENFMR
jgi:Zn-finger domain-containing protein